MNSRSHNVVGSRAERVASMSSFATEVSLGTTVTMQSPGNSSQSLPMTSETYDAVLKTILFDYKNEPRFMVPRVPSRSASPVPTRSLHSNDDRSRRHSWLSGSTMSEPLPTEAITKLKDTMVEIAMGQNRVVKDPLTKRCFLHLYNDLLKPDTNVSKVEELVVMFVGNATKEIKLYQEAHPNEGDVFKETEVFIAVFLRILGECRNSEASIKKLQDYRESLKPSISRPPSSNQLNEPHQKMVTPTYNISEISGARLIGELFGVDNSKLQQDVIRLKDIANEEHLLADLELYQKRLSKNEATFNPDDFDRYDDYFGWKKKETSDLELLIRKVKSTYSGSSLPTIQDYSFIPHDPRTAISDFVVRVLQFENLDSDVLISNTYKALLRVCCKYWRINDVSQAALLYQAAHLTILKNPMNLLNVEKTEALFNLFYKFFQDAEHPRSWPKVDKKKWITNLSNTYIQIMSSLRDRLTSIYAPKAPKLTPILKILYEFVEGDPLYEIILKSGLPQKWIKRLRNTVLVTTESEYIEILKATPRDDTLNLIHVKQTAEDICKLIQQLQKKFPKPLLNEIKIANEAGDLCIKLYCEDLKNILSHIEHYALRSARGGINPADAIETYSELNNLRDIYDRVKKSPSYRFPFELENFFFKYLDMLCDESINNLLPVIKRALDQDNFEPIDAEGEKMYSHSVLDSFKMINEVFVMFEMFNWQEERQMAYIYTKLMKEVSKGVVYYCSRVQHLVIEDLKDDISEDSTEKKTSVWLFEEMKNAVTNGSRPESTEPYSFKPRTCLALNNLSQVLKHLKKLEKSIKPERIKTIAANIQRQPNRVPNNVFTITVLRAENIKPTGSDGLSSTYVTLNDSDQRKQIGQTKTISKSLNPVYEEDFDFESAGNATRSITATIWNHGSRFSAHELLGRTVLQLDPKKFRNDGLPEEIIRDFDLQGKLVFQVSLESEKDDIIFSMGRAYRCVTRTMERLYTSIVEKFSVSITVSFSRQTLKSVCGNNGFKNSTSDDIKDAIVPLFNYLNSNLQVLAATLDLDILLRVMLQAWKVVLNSADNLLLPALASVKVLNIISNNSTWKDSLTTVMANVSNSVVIPGYGRALTPIEVHCVFVWLDALCEFFYNEGSGPSLEELKGEHYQRLIIINKYYDESVEALKSEVDTLTPLVLKAIKARNFLDEDDESSNPSRRRTIARSNTIVAYGSSERRKETNIAAKESDKLTGTFQIYTEDVILRVLMAKGEKEFVSKRLSERERIAKSLATERLARLAVRGKR